MWNIVASETREGSVFIRLLEKIENEREALGGQVFDVLGKVAFEGRPLRELLIEAIRYGDRPDVRAKLNQVVDTALDHEHLAELLEERALAHDSMDASRVRQVREDMERADARRLQPHFIESFFLEAFRLLGGKIHERESKRYEITHVPALIRSRDRLIGRREPVLQRYERITFEKNLIGIHGKPMASFVCPGHPLLDATIDLILERHRDLLKRGAVLIDPTDQSDEARVLFYLENSIQDARTDKDGNRRIISRQMHFVEINKDSHTQLAGYAPYLDYRPATPDEQRLIEPLLDQSWLKKDLEAEITGFAVSNLVSRHFEEVRRNKEDLVDRTIAAVKDRLTKEINYWDHRANELKAQELTGRTNARINSAKARQRADDLEARLQKRLDELEQERRISPLPPVAIGGVMVIPQGFLLKLKGDIKTQPEHFAQETARVEKIAMDAIMELERQLGYEPRDVSAEKCGYDIESRIPDKGCLRFIEVKGRVTGAKTVTITKNEILTAFNKPDDFILAIVEVDGDKSVPRYVRRPFKREPDFGVTSVNYDLGELLAKAEEPG